MVKKQHYLAVSNLSALLPKKSFNHDRDLYCLNCFNSYTTENKLIEHEEICNNHDSYHTEMPKQAEKILKYIHGEKFLKAPMFTSCSFDEKENQLNYYRIKYCIEKLCKKLKKCTMKIINYEKRK